MSRRRGGVGLKLEKFGGAMGMIDRENVGGEGVLYHRLPAGVVEGGFWLALVAFS